MSLKNLGILTQAISTIDAVNKGSADLQVLSNALNGISKDALLGASSVAGLSAEQLACALSAKGLTSAEIASNLALNGYSKAAVYAALQTLGLKDEQIDATIPSTSKLILLVGFLLCLEIIIFCQYAMITTMDLSALYAMIGIVATFSSMVLGYFLKSKSENTVGGITYDMAMLEASQNASYESTEGVE